MTNPTQENPAVERAAANTIRQTSNLLAIAFATHTEGDSETAFDLFLSAMENHLAGSTIADLRGVNAESFSEIIAQALTAAHDDTAIEAADSTVLNTRRPPVRRGDLELPTVAAHSVPKPRTDDPAARIGRLLLAAAS